MKHIIVKKVADIIYDEKLEDVEFVNEMKISYKNNYQQNQIMKANTIKSSVSYERKIICYY